MDTIFCPGNLVPGIAASPDKMLQARLFPHHDIQIHRLGPNYHLLSGNAPKGASEMSYQRDGFMHFNGNGGGGPNYWPNRFGGPEPDPTAGEQPYDVSSDAARYAINHSKDGFVQAKDLYRDVMTAQDRDNLISNIVDHLSGAIKRIQYRQTAIFYKADPDYGKRVADGVGLDINEVERLAELSTEERAEATKDVSY